VVWIARVFRRNNPAHSAAWHVGPGVGDLASSATPAAGAGTEQQHLAGLKKGGAPRAPLKSLTKNYRFFAAFFFAPLAAFFAIVFAP
jgi:hypothetical protein